MLNDLLPPPVIFAIMVGIGSVAGLLVGALPGLSVTMATALLVSLTYTWDLSAALGLIIGVYVSGVFAGAVSAVLLNIPGAPSSIVTTLDGYPMSCKGYSHKALYLASVYSFVGGIFGFVALGLIAPALSTIALKFTPFDYFLLGLVGLSAAGSFGGGSKLKGGIAAAIGLLLACVGADPIVGSGRFTFGNTTLMSGIPLVPALIGIFGMGEVLLKLSASEQGIEVSAIGNEPFEKRPLLRHLPLSLYASTVGTLIGALPGAGGPVASLIAYDQAKKITKNPVVPFGEGAEEGIVASEAANNACVGGALIPLLTLAVPGDAVTAVLISVFYIHGLRPGPMLIRQSPEIFWLIVIGGILACFVMLFLGIFLAPKLSKVVQIPSAYLNSGILILCTIGAFAVQQSYIDVLFMLAMGLLAFFLRKLDYPVTPVVLGLVLGPMLDQNLRRAVSLASSADHLLLALFGNPLTLILCALLAYTLFGRRRK